MFKIYPLRCKKCGGLLVEQMKVDLPGYREISCWNCGQLFWIKCKKPRGRKSRKYWQNLMNTGKERVRSHEKGRAERIPGEKEQENIRKKQCQKGQKNISKTGEKRRYRIGVG